LIIPDLNPMISSISYQIPTDVPQSYMEKLFDFIQTQFLVPQKARFGNISKQTTPEGPNLSYSILDAKAQEILRVEVKGTKPIQVQITPVGVQVSEAVMEEAKQDLIIAKEMFEEKTKKTTLYFAWREGQEIIPEEFRKKEKPLNRLFLETQILLFGLFIVLSIILFLFTSSFLLISVVFVIIQFVIVAFSAKIIARTANWTITEKDPFIHILEYHLPLAENEQFKEEYPQEKLVAIKEEIYKDVIEKHGEIDCENAGRILEKHGVHCESDNLVSKKIDVYGLVKKIADSFGYKVPKIIISNTTLPNAAASGPSPSQGVVLITTGLFVHLNQKEIEGVLGHEFGHLRGRDPLILSALVSIELLFRFNVLIRIAPFLFTSFLFFIYFWAVYTLIFFIAKFFEYRADLVSGIVLGQPQILAGALEKIGFQRLLFERVPSFRVQEWLGLDPHPPIYFRVQQLEKLTNPEKIKHPLLKAIKDVTSGFAKSL
jgi:heat shock protein HtpX